ncbi:MAG: peptide/nickel transport system permease protein [Cryptosporangiaceae bacterium]|nr:peptide/nickel transport system permease protein [Cryptosporangiaceae bacterium]
MSTSTASVPRRSLRRSAGRGAAWAARRVLAAALVLWAAASFTFGIQALLPGDRATLLLNQQSGQVMKRTAAELAPLNSEFGFDRPLLSQYWHFVSGLVTGDLGTSYQMHRPVTAIIADQIVPTIVLTGGALVFAWIIAIVLTVATAGRGRVARALGSGFETIAAGVPHYWLGVILLVVFAVGLGLFPVGGGTGLAALTLPALTLAIPLAGFLGQVTRDEFEKALEQPFVTSARARGMGDLAVRLRHVLRHAILPAITLSGWALGALFSGAVIAESVFARPGIGQVLVAAANSRDVPVVTGIVLLVALVYVVANLLVDFAYVLVDRRLRVA